jgi:hypothetical protein
VKFEYDRNLRGYELAKQVRNLNGHQNPLRFIIFHYAWFALMLLGTFSIIIGPLKLLLITGFIGLTLEFILAGFYLVRTGKLSCYPGIIAWFDIILRRHIMGRGRRASSMSLPRH